MHRIPGFGLAPAAPRLLPALLVAIALTPTVLAAQDPAVTAEDSSDLAQDSSEAPEEVEPVTDQRADHDEAIRNQLQAVFDRVPDLADIDVTVDAGVVRLEGRVLRSETRTRAGELAAGMDGVLFLDNRIRESTSLEEQLQPTWTRLRELGFGAIAKLPLLLVAALIIGLAAALGSWLARWGGPKALRLSNPLLQSLVGRFLRVVIVLTAILVALDLLNATPVVGAVIGTAGLAGLALGFAFKDIVENYLAGTILAVRQPFEKDDHIRVDDFEGKVVRLTARETIMMTLDGNHVRLPNALIFRSPMLNYTRNPLRRFEFDAGLASTDDLAGVREAAVSELTNLEGVLGEPPPQVLVVALGASTVDVRFMAWVDQRRFDLARVRSEAIRRVKARLEREGFSLPSPEYLVQMRGESPRSSAPRGERGRLSAETPPAPPPDGDAQPPDLSVDRALDRQIEEDRRATSEPDLLESSTDPAKDG